MRMNKPMILIGILLLPLLLSCSAGRIGAIPSEVTIGNERYHVDTLKQRWGRYGDAPEVTCLFFSNVRDTIVGTEKRFVVRYDTHDVVIRDSSNHIIAEYSNIHPFYYGDDLLLTETMPETLNNQVVYALKDELSPRQRKQMADNLTLFCVELLVGSNGLILEACQYIYMDSIRVDKQLLNFCAKLDQAVKNASVYYEGSIWMRENDIPYGPTRTKFIMTENGLVYPSFSQMDEFIHKSRERW